MKKSLISSFGVHAHVQAVRHIRRAMEQHSLFGLPGFSNQQVEKRFLEKQNRALSKHDAQTYLAFATLWLTGTLWLMSHGR